MRKLIIISSVGIILSSCHHEWVLRPEIKGRILSKQNKPLVARIITLPVEGEEYEVAVNKDEGRFHSQSNPLRNGLF